MPASSGIGFRTTSCAAAVRSGPARRTHESRGRRDPVIPCVRPRSPSQTFRIPHVPHLQHMSHMSNMSAETFSTCKLLDVRGLRVSFDAVDVLHGVDLTVHCGASMRSSASQGSARASSPARSSVWPAAAPAPRAPSAFSAASSSVFPNASTAPSEGPTSASSSRTPCPRSTRGSTTRAARRNHRLPAIPHFRTGARVLRAAHAPTAHDIALELLRTVGITAAESA